MKFELNLSNYPRKADLKGAKDADISNVLAKSDLASSDAQVDKIDIGKLKTSS